MAFGKPGRPPEDKIGRRQQIFRAVAPMLAPGRVRELTMVDAARAAHLSVGGLYHYFPSKRRLALFGLDPANVGRICAEFRRRSVPLRDDPAVLLAAALQTLSRAATQYVRPSAQAALELDLATFRAAIDDLLTTEMIGLVQIVKMAHPHLSQRQADELNLGLRRVCTVAVLDPSFTAEQLHRHLRTTVNGALSGTDEAGRDPHR
jgi:AcrR family transcriptional regulator